jgi:hypothetical protein
VTRVRSQLAVSERRACRLIGQPRTTQRRQLKIRSDEKRLTAAIIRLAKRYGRYGYRRVTALLRAEGWKVNVKRVQSHLAAGRAQSSQEATQARSALAERRFVRAFAA